MAWSHDPGTGWFPPVSLEGDGGGQGGVDDAALTDGSEDMSRAISAWLSESINPPVKRQKKTTETRTNWASEENQRRLRCAVAEYEAGGGPEKGGPSLAKVAAAHSVPRSVLHSRVAKLASLDARAGRRPSVDPSQLEACELGLQLSRHLKQRCRTVQHRTTLSGCFSKIAGINENLITGDVIACVFEGAETALKEKVKQIRHVMGQDMSMYIPTSAAPTISAASGPPPLPHGGFMMQMHAGGGRGLPLPLDGGEEYALAMPGDYVEDPNNGAARGFVDDDVIAA